MRVPCGEHIILCGGNSFFTGYADRLKAELAKLAPKAYDINIYKSLDLNDLWLGASKLAAGTDFANERMITKDEFNSVGAKGSI